MSRDGLSVGDYGYPLLQGAGGKPRAERAGWVTALSGDTLTVEAKTGARAHYNRQAAGFIGFVEQEPGSAVAPLRQAHQSVARRAID
jgi:hypothetical protein